MTEAFVGEIRMYAGNYAPEGWAFCWGQILQTAQYDVLFSLIGTTYGGDGRTTFALPDLRSRVPVHMGTYPIDKDHEKHYLIGQPGGAETVVLSEAQLPAHAHVPRAHSAGNCPTPGGNLWAASTAKQFVAANMLDETMSADSMGMWGRSTPAGHANLGPYLAINFIIALDGIFPTQS